MLLILISILSIASSEALDRKESHFERITPYRFVGVEDYDKVEFAGCNPERLWFFSRHGTRTPEDEEIVVMEDRLPELRKMILKNKHNLIERHEKLFEDWKVPDVGKGNRLTDEGEAEMRILAERIQARFPTLLPNKFDNSTYRFQYTDTHRTKDSCKSFAKGLFGKEEAKEVWYPEPDKTDPILRFYKHCTKWQLEIKENPDSWIEYNTFVNGLHMNRTINQVENRLGFKLNTLSYDDLNTMYKQCAFETSWDRSTVSPWCSVFSIDDIQVLEYAADLQHYYIDGYGHDINYQQACPAFKDMFDFLDAKSTEHTATLYFTHSSSVMQLMSLVGIHQDLEKLSYANVYTDRQWRGATIGTFANNLAFLSFGCKNNSKKVLLMHQERVVRFPACPEQDLCDIEIVRQHYKDSINCRFEEICAT